MGENKRYYWLRLYSDFFSSKRIKKLRSIAGGDTYTIIYLKMQLKALDSNGYLYYDGLMDDFAEELALDLDEKADDVKMTITYLLSVGLIESSESGDEYYLTYMDKVIGSETASAQRVRDYRNRKALHCNTDVTNTKRVGNAEKEKEKEIEKDKKEGHATSRKAFVKPSVEEVRQYCQERKNKVDAQAFVDFYESKGWMVGKNHMKDWKACVRTWEKRDDPGKKSGFNQFTQNEYDYAELERRLVKN